MEAARIVGREPELAALGSALAAARRGRASWVQLVGEPGIGKSSLLRELCATAERQGCRVLSGRATEFESDMPYGVLIDALDRQVAELGADRAGRLSRGHLDELARMLPALRAGAGDDASGVGDERHRLHYAVRALLEGLADARPVVLALDDVHWADAASLELVGHLVTRLPLGAILVVVTYRPGQVGSRLARVLQAAAREPGCARVALGPLSRAAARELVGDRVPKADQDALYTESGGNPLFLTELARAGASDNALRWDPPAVPELPPGVLAALAGELDALSPAALVLARGAAIAGDPFMPALAATTAGLTGDGLGAFDELARSGLVAATETASQFRFRHPVVRHAVYATAGAGWRLGAHARAAAALERAGARPALRAHHVELSARPGDETAIALLAEAAAEAAPRAPATAATWWAAALRLLPAGYPPERRLELLFARATSLGAAGRLEESRDALREVLPLLPGGRPGLCAEVVAFIAHIERHLGHEDEAHALLTQTLALQPDARSPEATVLRIELAYERYFVGDWTTMREHADEALHAARERGQAPLRTAAAVARALAEYQVGHVHEAVVLLGAATRSLDALTDDELAVRLDAALWASWCELCVERFDAAQRHAARGLAVARRVGRGSVLVPMTIVAGWACAFQGDLPAAAELGQEAVDAARLRANDQLLVFALQLRCWVATLAGDASLAVRLGEEAVSAAGALTSTVCLARAGCYLAEARLEAGDPEAARAGLLEAAGGPELPHLEPASRARWYEILTRAAAPAEAERWAARAAAAADGLGLDGRTADALRARAAVRLAGGNAVAAAELALAAARAAEPAGNRIDQGRALTLAGAALAACGEPAQARAELEHAEALLDACGARRLRDEAARRLRGLGHPVARQGARRRRPAAGVGALTDRERELAELVSGGHTNRAIAAQLHLSPKTVETHLANIFAKLEVRSRAAVAALIAGAAPPGTRSAP